jgi:hypothetical protein
MTEATDDGTQSQSDTERLRGLLCFLNELCTLAKAQQAVLRNKFFLLLRDLGVLEVTLETLRHAEVGIRLLGSEVLSSVVMQDQCDIRAQMLRDVAVASTEGGEVLADGALQRPSSDKTIAQRMMPMRASAVGVSGEKSVPLLSFRSVPLRNGGGQDNRESVAEQNGESSQRIKVERATEKSGTPIVTSTPPVSAPEASADCTTGRGAGKAVGKDSSQASDDDVVRQLEPAAVSSPLDAASSNELFPLLGGMMDVLCNDSDSGVFLAVLEQLKVLLDPTSMRTATERERFLDVFYERFVSRLLPPLAMAKEDDMDVELTEEIARRRAAADMKSVDDSKSHICDLLAYCVTHHSYRIKYFILGSDVVGKALRLLRHRRPHVRLAALRFCRACIGAGDDVYDRYIVKNELLTPVFELFATNNHRDNVLNSAVLELVAFVSTEHRLLLLQCVLDNHSALLEETVPYSTVFSIAQKSLEAIKGSLSNPTGGLGGGKGNQLVGTGLANAYRGGSSASSGDSASLGPMQIDSPGRRFSGSGLFAHNEIRIAPDQDEDEDYFATGDDDDASINELHRIIDGSTGATAGHSTDALLAAPGDESHGLGVSVHHSGSGVSKGPGRELLPTRRRSILRSVNSTAGTSGTGAGLSGIPTGLGLTGASLSPQAGGLGSPGAVTGSSSRRCSSPTGMSVAFPLGDEDVNVPSFDDAVLNSTWSSRGAVPRGSPLVDYAFDGDDMFASASNVDAPVAQKANRPMSLDISSRSGAGLNRTGFALSLKFEGGGVKETTRVVMGDGDGGGSRGGVLRLFDDGNGGTSARVDSANSHDRPSRPPIGSSAFGGKGIACAETKAVCDSGADSPSSPKKRRRVALGSNDIYQGSGMEASTKFAAATTKDTDLLPAVNTAPRTVATEYDHVHAPAPPGASLEDEHLNSSSPGVEGVAPARTGDSEVEIVSGSKRQRVSPDGSPARSPATQSDSK